MNLRLILFLMMGILVTLLVFSKFFREKEQKRSKLEVSYFEALSKYKLNRSPENLNAIEEIALEYGMHLKLDKDSISKMVERDVKAIVA